MIFFVFMNILKFLTIFRNSLKYKKEKGKGKETKRNETKKENKKKNKHPVLVLGRPKP